MNMPCSQPFSLLQERYQNVPHLCVSICNQELCFCSCLPVMVPFHTGDLIDTAFFRIFNIRRQIQKLDTCPQLCALFTIFVALVVSLISPLARMG
jgi:hypothetical protein